LPTSIYNNVKKCKHQAAITLEAVNCPSTLWSRRPFAHNFSHFKYTQLLDPERRCLWQTVVSCWRHPCCSCKSRLCWMCILGLQLAYWGL